MKKVMVILILGLLLLTACSSQPDEQEHQRYSTHFLETFDTVVQVIGYTSSEEEFHEYADEIKRRYQKFHKLYDKFNDYEGINNIKTINDNAGIEPVKVEPEIIDLILFSKDWHERTYGKMNIASGSLMKIWAESRDGALNGPEQASLPAMEELQAASEHINIDDIIVDTEAMTVFLVDKNMSIDVGAIAKGFVAEIVGEEMMEKGFISGAIVSGGNWKVLGKPIEEDREHWTVAVQNPDKPSSLDESGILARVSLEDGALDTSGDYQRFAMIGNLRVHHIIDPETLMPGNYHRGVTVLADHSGVADFLSTELFLASYEDGRALVDSLDNVEALWVMPDGTVKATEGLEQ